MKQLVLLAALATSLGANAAELPCSIHPKKGSTDAELMKLAKVSIGDAGNDRTESRQYQLRAR